MSCKGKWQEYNDQLQAATQLAPGSADAALRCIKPECNRPLLKNGQCVMGHAQTAGEQAPAIAPLVDALRCVLEEETQAVLQHHPQYTKWNPLTAAQTLCRQLPGRPADLAVLEELLQAAQQLHNAADMRNVEFYTDPRVQAAAGLIAEQHLVTAAALASNPDPKQQGLAIQAFQAAEDWASGWHCEAAVARAQRGRQQILPVDDLTDLPSAVAAQINAVAGNVIFHEYQGLFLEGENAEIELTLVSQDQLDMYPDEVRDLLQQQLGVDIGSIAALWAKDDNPNITVPLSAVIPFLAQRRQDLHSIVTTLASKQEAMTQAAGQLTPAQLARQHALPLYQATMRLQQTHEASLQSMGLPGEDLLQRMGEVRSHALQVLQSVPLPQLPQALAGLGYEKRVLDLLKFKAVRDAVLNPENTIDFLTHLPKLAPRAVAALRGCELMESLLAVKAKTGAWRDQRTVGPQSETEVATLIEARKYLSRVREDELAAQAGQPDKAEVWLRAVATVVDALSEHAPPAHAAQKFGWDGYTQGSRLAQARAAHQDIWWRGDNSKLYSSADVHKWAEAAQMPLGRYAPRNNIIEWLRTTSPAAQRQAERQVRAGLDGRTSATLRAVDRTGMDRLYKKGERVRISVGGQEREGQVLGCTFLPSAEKDQSREYPYEAPVAVYPAVTVALTDGSTQVMPIAQVEVVKPKKK